MVLVISTGSKIAITYYWYNHDLGTCCYYSVNNYKYRVNYCFVSFLHDPAANPAVSEGQLVFEAKRAQGPVTMHNCSCVSQ